MCEIATVRHALRGQATALTSYRRSGRGTPVILLHGVGMSATIWQPQIVNLETHYEVVAIDLFGHGGSSMPPADALLSDYAEQIMAVAAALNLHPAHIVGHSMGALVALELALSQAGLVRSVTALNAVFLRTREQRQAVERRAAAIGTAGDPASPTMSLDEPISRWFGDPVEPSLAASAALVRDLLRAVDPVGYARTYRLFASSDTAHCDRLLRLAVPALFLTGEHDLNSTPGMSRAMARMVPGARYGVLSKARHMMPLADADEVNRRLRAFFAAVDRKAAPHPITIAEGVGCGSPSSAD
jgi:pimeloyl-ACP methyl ester carboxylesterase